MISYTEFDWLVTENLQRVNSKLRASKIIELGIPARCPM